MNIISKFIYSMLRRFFKQFLLLVFIITFQVALTSLSVISIAPIVDLLASSNQENQSVVTETLSMLAMKFGFEINLLFALIFYGVVSLLTGIVGFITQYSTFRIKYSILGALLSDTLSSFFRTKLLFFTQGDLGEMLNSFQQEISKIGNSVGLMALLLTDIFQAIALIAIPLFIAPKITLIFLIATIVLSIPVFLINRIVHSYGEKSTKTSNHFVGVLHEAIISAKLILAFAKQAFTINRFNHAFKKHADAAVKLQTMSSGLPKLFVPLFSIGALIACYYSYLESTPLSDTAIVLFALIRISPVIGKLIESKVTISGFVPAYEQIERLGNEASLLEESSGSERFDYLKEGINFDSVSFGYPEREKIINNINLKIVANKTCALVGTSGAGKTTLIDLMLGLHVCEDGQIQYDGKNIQEYNFKSLRERVGYVPQEAQLFSMSIRENLLWSSPNATEYEMWRACKIANAENFIKDLPIGLDTQLGDRGSRISGGQRQRIALARAIINNPSILILDEATSSLDSESENLIRKSIENLSGKMTIIIIAHRLSTIKNSDYIYVLEGGSVLESGSYNQLSKNKDSKLSFLIKSQSI